MDKPLGHLSPLTRAEQRWENEGGGPSPLEGGEGRLAAGKRGEGSPSPQPPPSREERATLRQLAMNAIANTRFVPEKGRNRLGSMVEQRPDWVISRQRPWGLPIALFVDKKSGELLVDQEVNQRIVEAVRAGGVDAWDEANAAAFLGNRNPDDYEMVS